MQADHEPVQATPGKGSLPKRESRRAARAAQLSRLWALSEGSDDDVAQLSKQLRALETDTGAALLEQV